MSRENLWGDIRRSWVQRQLAFIIDLLGLILDHKLAAIISRIPDPKPGDALLVSDPLVIDRIERQMKTHSSYSGVIPIIRCKDVNNFRLLSFEELTEAWNEAYEARANGEREESSESGSREEGWSGTLTN